jgi:aspartyl/asparaginyl-tRNA synthetase
MNPASCINSKEYDYVVSTLRAFFQQKGFAEVHTQSRLSILAACEDPRTIATFNYAGNVWPLPQTGQMWLEHELLNDPSHKGLFCVSTSFRNEPNPIPGRHDLIFPMFEFETHGDIKALEALESELLEYLEFGKKELFKGDSYDNVAAKYGVKEIHAEQEEMLYRDYGSVFFLKHFPQYTSPFWNMKKDGDHAQKIDVILCGVETIGSAERSSDKDEMSDLFHTISNGMYADILYSQFGKDRVEKELNEFLAHDFFPRCGGGIGITRMIRALKRINQI